LLSPESAIFGSFHSLARLWIDVTFPPIRGAFLGSKSAIDSGRGGGLEVQTIVAIVKGEPPNFFFLEVAKSSYDFRHKAPDLR